MDRKRGLSTFELKMIAMITMLIDHCAIKFFSEFSHLYDAMRAIGRLSFPIFCFILAEGFFYTRNRRKYSLRLLIFALISEVPYDMFGGSFFNINKQSVMFTLLLGFLTIWAIDYIRNSKIKYPEFLLRSADEEILNTILELIALMSGIFAAYVMNSTYSYAGVLLVLFFYITHQNKIGQIVLNLAFNVGMYRPSIQWLGVLSAIPIALYNGKLGSKKGQYIFYWFYPVHLLILVVLNQII